VKLKGTVVYAIIICIGIGAGLSLYQAKEAFIKKSASLTFDTLFSNQFKDEVAAFAREQERITTPADIWAELLKERFPGIEHVHIRLTKQKILLKLKAYRPVALVNKEFVLLEHGALVSKYHFIKLITKSLKSVTLTQKNMGKLHVCNECQSFIKRCNSSFCRQYTMTWYSPTHIELHNNYHKNVTVITTSENHLDKETQDNCKHIADALMDESKKKNKKWGIDIRFKNQIIVAMR
jgi:hypothetical protein